MNVRHRFVVGIDFSADTAAVLARAGLLAQQHGGTLQLLHVISREYLEPLATDSLLPAGVRERLGAAAEDRLRALAATLPAPIRATIELTVVVGEVRDCILEAGGAADLLVLGPRGANPLRNLFIGSTADRLLRASRCPVLVVQHTPIGPYGSVVLPLDEPERAQDAFAAATRWAPDAAWVGVHAMRVPLESTLRLAGADDDAITRVRARARQEAASRFASLEPPKLRQGQWRLSIAEGDPTPVILDEAATARADLIVIGKQGRSAWHEFLLGSVTRRVLATAECDVLVVPPADRPR